MPPLYKFCVLHQVFKNFHGILETRFIAFDTVEEALDYAKSILTQGAARVSLERVIDHANSSTEINTGTTK